jgi:hypothetical protein
MVCERMLKRAHIPKPLSHPDSRALEDRETLRQMIAVLRQSLSNALARCAELARNLESVDPDQSSRELHAHFDPHARSAAIQDLFADAFGSIWSSRCDDTGMYELWEKDELPSGATSNKP